MPRIGLPKRVRREIASDEHLRNYYRHLVSEATKRGRIQQVIQRRSDGVRIVMQILAVRDSGDGLIIEVR